MAADDAFALLGNETRIQILKAVWRRTRSEGIERDGPVSFSALQAAVGAPDSGNFSYHLDQLVGPFIARVDGGYVIRRAGSHIVRAILAGSVTEEASFGPVVVDETCYRCDSPIAVSYDDDHGPADATGRARGSNARRARSIDLHQLFRRTRHAAGRRLSSLCGSYRSRSQGLYRTRRSGGRTLFDLSDRTRDHRGGCLSHLSALSRVRADVRRTQPPGDRRNARCQGIQSCCTWVSGVMRDAPMARRAVGRWRRLHRSDARRGADRPHRRNAPGKRTLTGKTRLIEERCGWRL